ncbi:hypothetical protein [Chromobacterium amazonense]
MPHCVIECSAELASHSAVEQLGRAVHDAANSSEVRDMDPAAYAKRAS